ncbi:MAG: MliC family protein [Candidatus Moraniibacteriota bacterium]|jgi:membrane-bound inhibitor of C-type lysozyme
MNKKVIVSAVAALIFLVGCGGQDKDVEENVVTQPSESAVTYDCEGEDVKADFNNDVEPSTATVYISGQEMTLPNVEAASGAKYSDGEVTFWTHQGEATLSMEGTDQSLSCVEVMNGDVIVDANGNTVTAGCQSWFDGCNNCKVGELGMPMACTRMACTPETMKPARCMDESAIENDKKDCAEAGGVWSDEQNSCFEDPATMAGPGEAK